MFGKAPGGRELAAVGMPARIMRDQVHFLRTDSLRASGVVHGRTLEAREPPARSAAKAAPVGLMTPPSLPPQFALAFGDDAAGEDLRHPGGAAKHSRRRSATRRATERGCQACQRVLLLPIASGARRWQRPPMVAGLAPAAIERRISPLLTLADPCFRPRARGPLGHVYVHLTGINRFRSDFLVRLNRTAARITVSGIPDAVPEKRVIRHEILCALHSMAPKIFPPVPATETPWSTRPRVSAAEPARVGRRARARRQDVAADPVGPVALRFVALAGRVSAALGILNVRLDGIAGFDLVVCRRPRGAVSLSALPVRVARLTRRRAVKAAILTALRQAAPYLFADAGAPGAVSGLPLAAANGR